jgi:phage-related protein
MSVQRRIRWIGSSLKDLREFPDNPRREVGNALYQAQIGEKHPKSKPFKGFHGASVLEIADDFDSDTYRAVYTVRFEEAVYVLHCFQKKSKSGISTPKQDIELIERRLKSAELEHQEWQRLQNQPEPKGIKSPKKRP